MASIDLCALADVKAALESTSTARDTLIANLITAASEQIINDVEREFAPATGSATRRFRLDDRAMTGGAKRRLLDLCPYDLRNATAVTLNPTASSPTTLVQDTDYTLNPAQPTEGVYTSLYLSSYVVLYSDFYNRFGYILIDIAGAWGFATVPVDVKEACVETVQSWVSRTMPALGLDATIDDATPHLRPEFAGAFTIPLGARQKLNAYRRDVGVF